MSDNENYVSDTVKRIIGLLESKNIEQQALADYLGIKRQNITEWKAGRTRSYSKYIHKIADFFGVSVDYLIFGTEPPEKNNAPVEIDKSVVNDIFKVFSTSEVDKLSSLSRDQAVEVVKLVDEILSK